MNFQKTVLFVALITCPLTIKPVTPGDMQTYCKIAEFVVKRTAEFWSSSSRREKWLTAACVAAAGTAAFAIKSACNWENKAHDFDFKHQELEKKYGRQEKIDQWEKQIKNIENRYSQEISFLHNADLQDKSMAICNHIKYWYADFEKLNEYELAFLNSHSTLENLKIEIEKTTADWQMLSYVYHKTKIVPKSTYTPDGKVTFGIFHHRERLLKCQVQMILDTIKTLFADLEEIKKQLAFVKLVKYCDSIELDFGKEVEIAKKQDVVERYNSFNELAKTAWPIKPLICYVKWRCAPAKNKLELLLNNLTIEPTDLQKVHIGRAQALLSAISEAILTVTNSEQYKREVYGAGHTAAA